MFHKYLLILTLMCGAVRAEINLYDEPTPWRPLKKEHALFYSAAWTVIGASLGHGIYLLAKTLKKPVDSDAIMNDIICGITIAILAKLVHHSVTQVGEGLQLYFDDKEQPHVG